MSRNLRLLAGTAIALAGLSTAQAQAPKISGLLQVWYTQMLDNNLRLNSTSVAPNKYYNLRSEFQENSFSIRRAEIKFSGKITDEVSYEAMIDPTISSGSILQDAAIIYKTPFGAELKVGQFKTLQGHETSSSELVLVERSQSGRQITDNRDRGAALSFPFGDPKAFGGKIHVGVFGGSAKNNDVNAQKEYAARLEMNYGRAHKFGFYALQGSSDVKDTTAAAIAPAAPPAGWPNQAAIYDNKDKTSNLGAFYQFSTSDWYASFEALTGQLGRRFPTLAASAPAVKREHLDQKFLTYTATMGYTFGNHTVLGRYDFMNYNQGGDWYTPYNPYTHTALGTPRLVNGSAVDYTPEFTEITLGYTYAFKPDSVKAANIKVNYVMRSKNFLVPRATPTIQTGEQGGDSLVVAFQIAF